MSLLPQSAVQSLPPRGELRSTAREDDGAPERTTTMRNDAERGNAQTNPTLGPVRVEAANPALTGQDDRLLPSETGCLLPSSPPVNPPV